VFGAFYSGFSAAYGYWLHTWDGATYTPVDTGVMADSHATASGIRSVWLGTPDLLPSSHSAMRLSGLVDIRGHHNIPAHLSTAHWRPSLADNSYR